MRVRAGRYCFETKSATLYVHFSTNTSASPVISLGGVYFDNQPIRDSGSNKGSHAPSSPPVGSSSSKSEASQGRRGQLPLSRTTASQAIPAARMNEAPRPSQVSGSGGMGGERPFWSGRLHNEKVQWPMDTIILACCLS